MRDGEPHGGISLDYPDSRFIVLVGGIRILTGKMASSHSAAIADQFNNHNRLPTLDNPVIDILHTLPSVQRDHELLATLFPVKQPDHLKDSV